jgi:hypothetical protein
MGMVLAKRAAAPAGSTLVVEVDGSAPAAFGISDSGRGGALTEVPATPTVHLTMDRETFIVLAGGRRTAADVTVAVAGDEALAARILAGMALTP